MRVALIGNQNCGKTSLFNRLTGSNQKIGNWPGVTIEKKEGVILGTDIEIVDLPGVYSLNPYTEEEVITRNYLIESNPDLIINVVDINLLERSLYLTTEMVDFEAPMILVLNMVDIFHKDGGVVDEGVLASHLGVDVVSVSAKTGLGIDDLIKKISNIKTQNHCVRKEKYSKIIEKSLKILKNQYNKPVFFFD